MEYLEAGAALEWVIYPERRLVVVHTSRAEAHLLFRLRRARWWRVDSRVSGDDFRSVHLVVQPTIRLSQVHTG